ncbi:MAG: tRNA-dihydrouridine synthase, partial [Clostridia bacterium]|nr:tRNA-dihydrouridine synthase [Clostridia bacterium]
MKIGHLKFNGYAALAPMAGVADRAMRELCRSFGAAYCVSELISAKGISMGDRKSASLMACSDAERPVATQLFGSD